MRGAALINKLARNAPRARVERPFKDKSGAGGVANRAWATVAANLSVAVQDTSANIRRLYARAGLQVTHAIFSYADHSDIREGDRIVMGDRVMAIRGVVRFPGTARIFRFDVEEQIDQTLASAQ